MMHPPGSLRRFADGSYSQTVMVASAGKASWLILPRLHLAGDHGIGFVLACTSAGFEPKTIVAYGFIFGCRLASFAPFSTLAAPVAARWHCTAPTTELTKSHSQFAPSRLRSFREIQFSGMPNRCSVVLSADERRWTQINSWTRSD